MKPEIFYKRINNYGRRQGLDVEESNDFASYSICIYLTGRKASFKQYYIDYLRQRFGNKRSKHFQKQRAIKIPDYSLEENLILTEGDELEKAYDLKAAIDLLNPKEKYLLYLKYRCGHTSTEIAEILGVCRKTVWDRLRVVMEKLRGHIND